MNTDWIISPLSKLSTDWLNGSFTVGTVLTLVAVGMLFAADVMGGSRSRHLPGHIVASVALFALGCGVLAFLFWAAASVARTGNTTAAAALVAALVGGIVAMMWIAVAVFTREHERNAKIKRILEL